METILTLFLNSIRLLLDIFKMYQDYIKNKQK